MKISVLVPTFCRTHQLAEALASLGQQNQSLIGEILVGDDGPPTLRNANQAVIANSSVASLVRYLPNDPSLGNYPNQWALGDNARFDHILILHDDDRLCPGGLDSLARARLTETDRRVKIWFGGLQIMDENGSVDAHRTSDDAKRFGKDGPPCAKPVWDWCLTQSLPPNSSLLDRDTYQASARGERDGNVGDWGLHVRLANTGAWGRFIGQTVSQYRVQPQSVTHAGAGIDVHLMYEIATKLRVPATRAEEKRLLVREFAEVASTRYLRAGERTLAWRCFASSNWDWRWRLSVRGVGTLAMLVAPPWLLQSLFERRAALALASRLAAKTRRHQSQQAGLLPPR